MNRQPNHSRAICIGDVERTHVERDTTSQKAIQARIKDFSTKFLEEIILNNRNANWQRAAEVVLTARLASQQASESGGKSNHHKGGRIICSNL